MKTILVSAAALALMAAPAFAQNNEHHDHDNGGGNAPHAMSAQHPDRNPDHGNMGGAHPAMSGPAAQPNGAMSMQHGDHNDHHDNNNNDHHDNNNNNGYHGGGMAGPGNGMHGPSHNYGQSNGPHVTNFNSYHRNFTAPRRFHAPTYRRPPGWYSHRWTFGERLPPAFFVRDYWLSDFLSFGLISPPYGAVWVRYGSDALLIDEASGEVIQVAYGVFY